LLAYTLGPAAASVVMTAILAIQALVFQDGGILALGANLLNMAVVGVWAAYLPFRLWGSGRGRKLSIFAGAMLSVLASALLAIAELAVSGVKIPVPVLVVSVVLFLVSAALEGAITLAVMEALEAVQPNFVHRPAAGRPYAAGALALAAVALAAVGILFASTHPDGLMKLAEQVGISARARPLVSTPLADYELTFIAGPWLRKAAAGLAGLLLIYAACALVGRMVSRNRSA
jgi:cobalt/nickel transport system permease protein